MKCKGGRDSEMGTEFPPGIFSNWRIKEINGEIRSSSERQEEFMKTSNLVVHKGKTFRAR